MSQKEPIMSQRARFEHWFSDQGEWPQAVERSGEGYKLMQAQSAWAAWQAACPEGWQCVPVALTNEMVRAFAIAAVGEGEWNDAPEDQRTEVTKRLQSGFNAMLSAAPKPDDA